jgi:hypothetical protein
VLAWVSLTVALAGSSVAQLHVGAFALRAEHERFKIGRGAHMTSVGLIWQFL